MLNGVFVFFNINTKFFTSQLFKMIPFNIKLMFNTN